MSNLVMLKNARGDWRTYEVRNRPDAERLRGTQPANIVLLYDGGDTELWKYLLDSILTPMARGDAHLEIYRRRQQP